MSYCNLFLRNSFYISAAKDRVVFNEVILDLLVFLMRICEIVPISHDEIFLTKNICGLKTSAFLI